MKKNIIICIIIIVLSISIILYYNKYNMTQKELLTKNVIFDIIEDVEGIVISCITKSGNKSMSEQDKLDIISRYIIKNREKYNTYIIDDKNSTYYNKEENIYFGKIEKDVFNDVLDDFFEDIQYPVEKYKYYKDGFIQLKFEPIESVCWDEKEYIKIQEFENKYIIDTKYIRTLNNKRNEFYVQYIFNTNKDVKIDEVTIYNSIMN